MFKGFGFRANTSCSGQEFAGPVGTIMSTRSLWVMAPAWLMFSSIYTRSAGLPGMPESYSC